MVNKQTIINFFDNEAEASRENWERLMAFPLKERIRKRKAIDGLQLVEGSKRVSEENEILIQFSYTRNLSDFKEGDYLFLHEEGTQSGMQCSLYEYSEENTLTISVFQPNLIYTDEYLKSKTWLLDRAYVDLRKHVFANFFCGLSNDSDYWEKCLVNNPITPELCDVSSADEELDDTIANFGFSFTEKQREAIINAMATNDYYLIQGPPGTGKSFVLGVIILEEVLFFNHKVIVIGPNHMAINNAIGQLLKITPNACNYVLKVGQANNAPTIKVEKSENGEVGITNYHHLNVPLFNQTIEKAKMGVVVGLTPHSLYTSRAQGLECDTLVVDEAGQMTIPLGLMGMIKAKKVIFAGDHRQLPPIVTSDKISEDMKQSIFQKLMRDDNCTMLDTTFRMCVPI